jgi:acyl carrier protein
VDLDARLQDLFREFFGDDTLVLTDSTTAVDIPDWDSLQHVTLLYLVEDEFGVTFVGDEASTLADVGELKRLLRAKLGV